MTLYQLFMIPLSYFNMNETILGTSYNQVVTFLSFPLLHGYFFPGTKHRAIKVIGTQNQVQVALSIVMAKLHGS